MDKKKFPHMVHWDYSGGKFEFSNGKVFPSEELAYAYRDEVNNCYLAQIDNSIMRRLAQEILAYRKDYLDVVAEHVQNCSIAGLQECLKRCQFREQCVYQRFGFKNEIKEYYYAGHLFGQLGAKPNVKEAVEAVADMARDEDFMAGLVKHFFELLGEGNYYYDFWEFGQDDFSLFFGIHKSVYKQKMQEVKNWLVKEKIQHLVEYKLKEVNES